MDTAKPVIGKALFIIIMAATIIMLGASAAAFAQTSASKNETGTTMDLKNSKILIAYFSYSGNTRSVAGQLQKIVGGHSFEIVTVEAYPKEYNPTTVQARKELDENLRPALTAKVDDMADYDVIFLGYPNWWGTLPMALFTFLEQYDLSGKTIVPFCTHEGSRLGRSVDDLRKLAPKATVLNGFEIRGSRASQADEGLRTWLRGLGLIES